MAAAREPRLRLSRRRPPSGDGSPGAARSARRPPRSSQSDPRPSPGRPFRRPRGAPAAFTGLFAGQDDVWSPLPGPPKYTRRPSPVGPPAQRSSLQWRGHRPCRAARCASRTPSCPRLPHRPVCHSRKKASTSPVHFIPRDITLHRVLFLRKMCTFESV
uniref:FA core complex associated protein 20 n=1 Tax=Propithecus coquereli TaxID=379532 RepID=A0A2K6F2H9_PROCO